jgi:choline dehydrogenase
VNIVNGARFSPAEAYLTPDVVARPNLYIKVKSHVHKILFDNNKKAIGVVFRDTATNEIITVNAKKEIILSAGVFGTPQILLLSGVGPAQDLRKLGIDVVHNSLAIGAGLVDHTVCTHKNILTHKIVDCSHGSH